MANLICPYCHAEFDLCKDNSGSRQLQIVDVPCKKCGTSVYKTNELTSTKYYLIDKTSESEIPWGKRKTNDKGQKIKLGPICKCKLRMEARSGKYGPFWACMGVPGCGMTKKLRKRNDS
ncbi:hypothetical protein [Leptospira neocaledonica]|uniref:Uncharacterized protein n=1 Tax=Leptospira neocaledonica TaxID=2023192 RepID=A0A2M9ZZF2_9LEPT|nr:hypothetical protein [Leptospira neocaledonica]PJZ77429.1 hypothetical protein CH365_07530 [Leptospira neocaledonica]